MNKMLLFIGIVIIAAIGIVMVLNKSTSTKAPVTANVDIHTSPATAAVSPVTSTPSPSVNTSPSTQPTAAQNPIATKAVITTSKGNIELQLYPDAAPKTVANFVKKAQSDFYKNLTFHRVEDWVLQGGDPAGNGTGGGIMPTELNDKPFVTGSLGVARGQDITISNDAQFFITKSDASWLNKQYTNFGIVTKGMDVVNKMQIGDKILGITTE